MRSERTRAGSQKTTQSSEAEPSNGRKKPGTGLSERKREAIEREKEAEERAIREGSRRQDERSQPTRGRRCEAVLLKRKLSQLAELKKLEALKAAQH